MSDQTFYHNPDKAFQGVEVPENESWSDFWRWWKSQCAQMDSKPKHIARSDRWTEGTKRGKRK